MKRKFNIMPLISISALTLVACAASVGDDLVEIADDRTRAIEALQRDAGAPIRLEVNETGTARVLAMTPRFPAAGQETDPVEAARRFLVDHRGVFQLSAAEAADFVPTRVDVEPESNLRHVTLQRTYHGIPVFQGAITVHMDPDNNVHWVLGDEFYQIIAPTNTQMLSPADAAEAAGKAFGLGLVPRFASSEGLRTTFTAPGTLDPITIEPRIFQVTPEDNRFAYQATVSWLDEHKQLQYELVLVDAQDGSPLYNTSLVNTAFSGRVFKASPGANPTFDSRVFASFDGNPIASPSGWVDATRRTRGNNAIAATDLDANNVIGPAEVQPTADVNGVFNFPFSPTIDAASFNSAAVTSAFYLVNDYHDRTYALGFTEQSGNFQTSNFGKGGLQADEVQVDVQDGAGLNNANFATPPDGVRPRMQMFLFTLNGGVREDGDFDPTVIYHENTHGLSNRLVGGGSTACLNHLQSGGMGEGWSDFMAASFLNNPVIGAYVTGNATVGIRQFSMANSPLTYINVQNGTLAEVHAVGELWAAALWDARVAVGGPLIERMVVLGMKLTPCHPSMLQARDAIIQADGFLTGGVNACRLFRVFGARQMGTGASSTTDDGPPTSTIVTSAALPPGCVGVDRLFTSADVPKNIPDNDPVGATSVINVATAGLDTQQVKVDVNITHTFRGDLVIQVISPDGHIATLSNREGGSAHDFVVAGLDISSAFPPDSPTTGTWRLFVRDLAGIDIGTINMFRLTIKSSS